MRPCIVFVCPFASFSQTDEVSFVLQMQRAISAQIANGTAEVDILSWMGRAALELVGQGGLGYSFDSLEDEMEDSYGNALKQLQ